MSSSWQFTFNSEEDSIGLSCLLSIHRFLLVYPRKESNNLIAWSFIIKLHDIYFRPPTRPFSHWS
jgi:hypothetical protein